MVKRIAKSFCLENVIMLKIVVKQEVPKIKVTFYTIFA